MYTYTHRRHSKQRAFCILHSAVIFSSKIALLRHCSTLQHTTTHCDTLQHTATHCSQCESARLRSCNILQHTASHCSTLQHTAARCNTLQHTAAHCNTLQHTATHYSTCDSTRFGFPHTCDMTCRKCSENVCMQNAAFVCVT